MPENDIIINPDGPEPVPPMPPAPHPVPPPPPAPQPGPAPEPAPAPKEAITPESLKRDMDTVLKVLRGVGGFLPAGPKGTLDKLLGLLDMARSQDWLFEVLVGVLNRFQGTQPTEEQFRQSVMEALAARGEQVAAQQAQQQ